MILRRTILPVLLSSTVAAGWMMILIQAIIFGYCCCIATAQHLPPSAATTNKYLLIGVSGGLQDGFPERNKMDYIGYDATTNTTTRIPAILIGKTVLRGYKAFLDVMESGYRQYVDEPQQPLINSNVFASGCYEHGNEYWFYLIDERQVLHVLMNEPRFLSISPDTGLIDLTMMRRKRRSIGLPQSLFNQYLPLHTFIEQYLHQIKMESHHNMDHQYVAVPLVTAVYYNPSSHVPSPIVYKLLDGLEITNYPDSLAIWANVNNSDRTALYDAGCVAPPTTTTSDCTDEIRHAATVAERRFWHGVRMAIRQAELQRLLHQNIWLNVVHPKAFWKNLMHGIQKRFTRKKHRTSDTDRSKPSSGNNGIPIFKCKQKIRFGAGPNTIRINSPFTFQQVHRISSDMKYRMDEPNRQIVPITTETVGKTTTTIEPNISEKESEL